MSWKKMAELANDEAKNLSAEGQKVSKEDRLRGKSLSEDAVVYYERAEACRRFAKACLELEAKGVRFFLS